MFAEMMKSRPWTWAELKAIGGTEGIGMSFLETAFYARTAPPERRVHQQAAQAVLKALLSEQSTELKGQVRSYGELLEASGYAPRHEEFDRLLGILDDELKLVTPVDAEEKGGNPAIDQPSRTEEKHYQLTHDYLVPAVRQWLSRKQRESRRGQCEIRLAERTDLWTVKRERKQLPILWEWLGIQLNTRRRMWTEPQRRMMQAATRWHLTRALLAAILLGLLVVAGFEIQGRFYSRALVGRLLTAENAEVPGILADMAGYQRWTKPLLTAKTDLPDQDRRDDLRVRLALVSSDSSQSEPLMQHLLDGPPDEVQMVRHFLLPHHHLVAEQAWDVLDDSQYPPARRLRAACALAGWNAQDARWTDHAEQVVGWLLSESPLRLAIWTTLLRPVDTHLLESLERAYRNDSDAVAHCGAAVVLSDFLSRDPNHLLALIKDARLDQLRFITDNLPPLGDVFCDQLTRELAELDRPEDDHPASYSARANVAIALLKLGRGDAVWPLLDASKDPTVRSYLIQRMAMADVDPSLLLDRLNDEPPVGVRRALLLSLGQYDRRLLSERFRNAAVQEGLRLYASDPDPGVHSASEWLLRRFGVQKQLGESSQKPVREPPDPQPDWCITLEGHTMARVTGPVEFLMGSPESDPERKYDEVLRHVTIDRSFAIATKELTIEQFIRFDPSYSSRMQVPHLKVPSIRPVRITVHEAMAYCNWLSQQEGLSEDQWCYKKVKEAKDGFEPHPDWLSRTGYRLTSEEEWEFACRAGTETSWFLGRDPALLPLYAWGNFNASGEVQPVGGLMPNDLGLFDVYGNVEEWCQDRYTDNPDFPPSARTQLYVNRSGHVTSGQRGFRSAWRAHCVGHQPGAGLRIARTLASVEEK
jgi:formylglycine-generating enzyme required for sulfatase activity